jgi:hypothetical protein
MSAKFGCEAQHMRYWLAKTLTILQRTSLLSQDPTCQCSDLPRHEYLEMNRLCPERYVYPHRQYSHLV